MATPPTQLSTSLASSLPGLPISKTGRGITKPCETSTKAYK